MENQELVLEDERTNREQQLQLMQKIQTYTEKLMLSQSFDDFMDQIRTSETSHHFNKLTRSSHKVKMVIYGIGSIEKDDEYEDNPRWQLSLAILMKRNLDWIGDMEVYDPVISLTESKVMEELGFRVLTVNEECKREALDPILFFMPHCHLVLYDNLLKANWRHDMLNRIVLLGNSFEIYYHWNIELYDKSVDSSFEKYCQERPSGPLFLLENGIRLLSVRQFTKELEMRIDPNDFSGAFFNLRWHFFSVNPDTNMQSVVDEVFDQVIDEYVSTCDQEKYIEMLAI